MLPAPAEAVHVTATRNPAAAEDVFYDLLMPQGQTDLANGRWFVRDHGDRVRWCGTWDKWLVKNGDRWQIDTTGLVGRLAKMTTDKLWKDLYRAVDAVRRGDMTPRELAAAASFCKKSSRAAGIRHMLWMASCDQGIAVTVAGRLKDYLSTGLAEQDLVQHGWKDDR
jgi:hypothetical protein